MVTFIGFAPDLDPETPGGWLDCDGLYGTTKGFRPEPGDTAIFPPIGGVFLLYDRTTPANIYEVVFSQYVTVGRSSGPAVGGILLNDGWIFYINLDQANYDQTPFADVLPWDNSHQFYVDTATYGYPELIYIP
jgi:hypothetical protein